MQLGMIWAQTRNGVIGRDGDMPWHLPEDLAHFKASTLGAPVIMGRRTWQSLPERVRPLPGRDNVVVTRNRSFAAEGATVVASLDAALAEIEAAGGETAWIMGGGELYRAGLSHADVLIVTVIDTEVHDGDTFAPEIGPEWTLAVRGEQQVSRTGLGYRFDRWERATQGIHREESGTLKP